jgi:hypothetical protein
MPLFLDGLWKEFEAAKFDKRKLKDGKRVIKKMKN